MTCAFSALALLPTLTGRPPFPQEYPPCLAQLQPQPKKVLDTCTPQCSEHPERSVRTTLDNTLSLAQRAHSEKLRYAPLPSSHSPLTLEQTETNPEKLSAFYNETVKELAVLRRSAIVNQLYGGWKLVVEKDHKGEKARGDN
jgi:hypothetical protein